MTIGVLWEFFECAMDQFFLFDMQKDTVLHSIHSVMLDPTASNQVVMRRDIQDVILVFGDQSRQSLGLGGYLDVGLIDTMKDLFVNFIGAIIFSFIGYWYARGKGKDKVVALFVPRKKESHQDGGDASQEAEKREP